MAEISKTLNSDLYPDLERRGGLVAALQQVLEELGTRLIVRGLGGPQFIVYASVHTDQRSSQVMVAANERAFHVDFWYQGVEYGGGWVGDLTEVGRAIVAFHVENNSVRVMAFRFDWFKANRKGLAHEGGSEYFVGEAWRSLEAFLKVGEIEITLARRLLVLVLEAARRPALKQLLPFTSLYHLCFSRTTGYPYSRDCPLAYPISDNYFRVMGPDAKTILGEGDANQAADILVANLPSGCGPAIHGTAENF